MLTQQNCGIITLFLMNFWAEFNISVLKKLFNEIGMKQVELKRFLCNTRKSSKGAVSSPSSVGSSPDQEILLPGYVDSLVESFWARMDQKIDSAISKYQKPEKSQSSKNDENQSTGKNSLESKFFPT